MMQIKSGSEGVRWCCKWTETLAWTWLEADGSLSQTTCTERREECLPRHKFSLKIIEKYDFYAEPLQNNLLLLFSNVLHFL